MQKTIHKLEEKNSMDNEKTPEKQSLSRDTETISATNFSTPLKETKEFQSKFKTPEKILHRFGEIPSNDNHLNENEKPEKSKENVDTTLDQIIYDGEDGMISTTEQARLLIAANRTPSKSENKTPIKQNTPSEKKSVENSPVTPGKYKRVELITLASPKAKRIKQI